MDADLEKKLEANKEIQKCSRLISALLVVSAQQPDLKERADMLVKLLREEQVRLSKEAYDMLAHPPVSKPKIYRRPKPKVIVKDGKK